MKKLLFTCIFGLASLVAMAQEVDSLALLLAQKPVRDPWLSTTFIDNQTTLTPLKNNFEFTIHHRFSPLDGNFDNLFGIYGASNIRLGINYGITNCLMLGFGTEKEHHAQEFLAKYLILEQNRGGSMPFSLAVYANTCISTAKQATFGENYRFIDRLSYFAQLIASRKFNDRFSLMSSASYSHINKVASERLETTIDSITTVRYVPKFANSGLGISVAGRYRVWDNIAVIAEFSNGFNLLNEMADNSQVKSPKPNFAVGAEIGTLTHSFQLFASSWRAIEPQNNYLMNQYSFTSASGIMFGFNIIVRY